MAFSWFPDPIKWHLRLTIILAADDRHIQLHVLWSRSKFTIERWLNPWALFSLDFHRSKMPHLHMTTRKKGLWTPGLCLCHWLYFQRKSQSQDGGQYAAWRAFLSSLIFSLCSMPAPEVSAACHFVLVLSTLREGGFSFIYQELWMATCMPYFIFRHLRR